MVPIFRRRTPISILQIIVACALFMENMDITLISTSILSISVDLGCNPIDLRLGISSYLVSLCIFMPISDRIFNRFGIKIVFRTAIIFFMVGSILSSFSCSLITFVLSRFLQGIAGGIIIPIGKLIILRTVSKSDLLKTMSYFSIPVLLGPVFGPPIGGFITSYFHWRWIFYINLPISILGLWLTTKFIDEIERDEIKPFDFIGFCIFSSGFSFLIFGLSMVNNRITNWIISFILIFLGFFLILVYIFKSINYEYPLIDFNVFKIKTFKICIISGIIFRVGTGSIPFLIPLMLQLGYEKDAFFSGMVTGICAFGAVGMKFFAHRILKLFRFKNVLITCSAITSLLIISFIIFSKNTPYIVILLFIFVYGCFRSMQIVALNTIVYSDIDQKNISQATKIDYIAQKISIGMGVSIGGSVLQASNYFQGHSIIVIDDFSIPFIFMGVISGCLIPFVMKLSPDIGTELIECSKMNKNKIKKHNSCGYQENALSKNNVLIDKREFL